MSESLSMHATTILMVRKGGQTVIGGDGQVSLGATIIKGTATKVRRLAQGGLGELGGDHGLGEIVGGVSGSFLGQRAVVPIGKGRRRDAAEQHRSGSKKRSMFQFHKSSPVGVYA